MPKETTAKQAKRHRPYFFLRWLAIPLTVYFLLFCLITWPWIANFNTHFLTDQGDGMQNVWNMWWVNKSVTELGILPWHTDFLHFPFGVTLIGQTLNPFNGFVAILVLQFLTLGQAYNSMVIFSFIVGGLTCFWLCYYFSKNYVTSIIGGAVFTFSSYHLAHAVGHMQLVSLEWVPLFILLWWKFLKKPSYWLATGAATSLLLVLLCDYYYFLYCLMTGIAVLAYLWYQNELPSLRSQDVKRPLLLLGALGIVLVAPLPVALLHANKTIEFLGSHPAKIFSTDLLSPFITGGLWRFSELTMWYWAHIKANLFEATVYLGVSVVIVLGVSLLRAKKLPKEILFWQGLLVFFGVLSLGPRLLVFGVSIDRIPLPYALVEKVIPGMKLSGMPVRMMVMVTLCAAIICSVVLGRIWTKGRVGKLAVASFCLVFLVEILPKPLPLSSMQYPDYVKRLKTLPPTGSVLDEVATEPLQLFNQTYHELRMPNGYVSRKPSALEKKQEPMYAYNAANQLDKLCTDYEIRYLVVAPSKPRPTSYPIIYQADDAIIYDLKTGDSC